MVLHLFILLFGFAASLYASDGITELVAALDARTPNCARTLGPPPRPNVLIVALASRAHTRWIRRNLGALLLGAWENTLHAVDEGLSPITTRYFPTVRGVLPALLPDRAVGISGVNVVHVVVRQELDYVPTLQRLANAIDFSGGVLVLHDEIDVAAGHLDLRLTRTGGGHPGVRNVRAIFPQIYRLRVGTGRPEADTPLDDFLDGQILGPPSETVQYGKQLIEYWVRDRLIESIRQFHAKRDISFFDVLRAYVGDQDAQKAATRLPLTQFVRGQSYVISYGPGQRTLADLLRRKPGELSQLSLRDDQDTATVSRFLYEVIAQIVADQILFGSVSDLQLMTMSARPPPPVGYRVR